MDVRNEEPAINYRALAQWRYEIRRFLRFSEQAARSAGVEPQQYQLLLALKGFPEGGKPTIGELAERLQIQHNSAVELIDRAVERNLAQRQRDESDQRQILVKLTAQGEDILERLASSHQKALEAMGPALLQALEAILTPKQG